MSTQISRRTFLKAAGASAAALGTSALLGGCQSSSNGSVEVKVGDKISNWNNLAVQFSGVYKMNAPTDVEGTEYLAVLVSAANRSSNKTFVIGAQNVAELNEKYPLTDAATKEANTIAYFHELAAATPDFTVSCDGAAVEAGAYVSLYDQTTETFSDSTNLPPQTAGYIELMCMVPTGWQQMTVTYTPTFVDGKTLVFTMKAEDVSAS